MLQLTPDHPDRHAPQVAPDVVVGHVHVFGFVQAPPLRQGGLQTAETDTDAYVAIIYCD